MTSWAFGFAFAVLASLVIGCAVVAASSAILVVCLRADACVITWKHANIARDGAFSVCAGLIVFACIAARAAVCVVGFKVDATCFAFVGISVVADKIAF